MWQYQLPDGFGYQLDAIIPAMRGETHLERMLTELAASALGSQAAIFVFIENDTFDSNTWEVTGPKSREWIALENWFISLGWTKLGETQTGIANLMGVDCRNHYYHPPAAPRPISGQAPGRANDVIADEKCPPSPAMTDRSASPDRVLVTHAGSVGQSPQAAEQSQELDTMCPNSYGWEAQRR